MKTPVGFEIVRQVHATDEHRLFEAIAKGGRRVALRVFSAGTRPMLDPAETLERMGEIQRGMELSRFATFTSAGTLGDGAYFVAEEWKPGSPIALAAWDELRPALDPLIDDLSTLHESRKWHGGIRASRLLWSPEGGLFLTGFAFATWLSTSVSEVSRRLEPDAVRAPELTGGPRHAGTALDVYGLSRALLENVVGLPPAVRSVLEAGVNSEPTKRPSLDQVGHLFRAAP